jgi:hypothetical protein
LGRAAVQTLTSGGSVVAIEAFCHRKTGIAASLAAGHLSEIRLLNGVVFLLDLEGLSPGICLTHRVIAPAISTGDMSLQADSIIPIDTYRRSFLRLCPLANSFGEGLEFSFARDLVSRGFRGSGSDLRM